MMKKIKSAIKKFSDQLERVGVFSPEKDAISIVAHVLGVDNKRVYEMVDDEFRADLLDKAEALIRRREKREPLHRILESMVFCGLKINVEKGVFRPCPETEALVETAIVCLEEKQGKPIRILDLGTGTGCVLLALVNALPDATGVGVDIEENILEAARKNAKENNLSDRVSFQIGDWGRGINEAFDLIICNPPAIATGNIPYYPPEMRDHNPLVSLDGGEDGLRFYKSIVGDFKRIAKPNALGVFRVYSETREAAIFDNAGFPIRLVTDYMWGTSCIIVLNEKQKRGFLGRLLQKTCRS